MDRSALENWIRSYERAWRSPGTEVLGELFAERASYRPAPYEPALNGRDEIARFWEAERQGPGEVFSMTSEVVVVERGTGVARIEVSYGEPVNRRYRDLWIVKLDRDGLCTAFEEWPFFPGQAWVAPGSSEKDLGERAG